MYNYKVHLVQGGLRLQHVHNAENLRFWCFAFQTKNQFSFNFIVELIVGHKNKTVFTSHMVLVDWEGITV